MSKWPCPHCKKDIDLSATICPHCQSQFTDEQVAERKKDARNGWAFGCVTLILAVLLLGYCVGDSSSDDETPVAASSSANAGEAAHSAKLSPEQEMVLLFLQRAMNQNISCASAVEFTGDKANDAAKGDAADVEVYDAAKRGVKECKDAIKYLPTSLDPKEFPTAHLQMAEGAVELCKTPSIERAEAMAIGMKLVEGYTDLETQSKYRALLRSAKGSEYLCIAQLQALAEKAKIPASTVHFIKPL